MKGDRGLYSAVQELRHGGGRVQVDVGPHGPERSIFYFEVPGAGGPVAWETLMWKTIRDSVYRTVLDQQIGTGGEARELRATICIRFFPAKRGQL